MVGISLRLESNSQGQVRRLAGRYIVPIIVQPVKTLTSHPHRSETQVNCSDTSDSYTNDRIQQPISSFRRRESHHHLTSYHP